MIKTLLDKFSSFIISFLSLPFVWGSLMSKLDSILNLKISVGANEKL